ncbi:hypothetical protein GC173_04585 [bacterium]|nr:hypothetical protein [bacterium]
MNRLLVPFLVVAMLAGGLQTARAEKWYHSEWFVGSAGLLVGGLVGYELGRADRPDRGSRHDHYDSRPSFSCVYSAPYYREETRVWPIYRRTRVYPLATIRGYHDDRPSAALPPGYDGTTDRYTRKVDDDQQSASTSQPLVIIGDSNQNISVTVNQTAPAADKSTETRTVVNYKVDEKAGRLSERYVDTQVPAEKSTAKEEEKSTAE